jgi:hypothetical protein
MMTFSRAAVSPLYIRFTGPQIVCNPSLTMVIGSTFWSLFSNTKENNFLMVLPGCSAVPCNKLESQKEVQNHCMQRQTISVIKL